MADSARVTINGCSLTCQHCGRREFIHKTATLDRLALGGLFHLEGLWGHETTIYVCAACGFAHLFMPVPNVEHCFGEDRFTGRALAMEPGTEEGPESEREGAKDLTEEVCISCGQMIPPEATRCPACGWTWRADEEAGA